MRGKDTKRTFFKFLPYECTAAEEYLELMAEKGWMLQSANRAFLKFKKIVPQKINYSVDILQKISVFDHKDSDVALEYREYCQAAGWNYVCQTGKIQIFYTNEDKKTISIHTDEGEKFKTVFKASMYNVGGQFILILMFVLDLYMQLFSGTVDYTLSSNSSILSAAAMISFIFINSIEIISFFLWVIKAKGKLKENKFMPYNNYKQLRIKNIFEKVYGLIIIIMLLKLSIFDNNTSIESNISLLLITCIPVIIMLCVKKFIDKKKYSKNINMAITISSGLISIYLVLMLTGVLIFRNISVIKQSKVKTEAVNLTLMDYGYNGTDPYLNIDESILAERISYSDSNGKNELSYTILQSKYTWIIKFDENRLLNSLNKYGIDLKKKDTNLPGNIKVYSDNKKGIFVLVSEDRVADIRKDFNGISDEEFLDKVYKRLLHD